jgi:hypothetical protein
MHIKCLLVLPLYIVENGDVRGMENCWDFSCRPRPQQKKRVLGDFWGTGGRRVLGSIQGV